MSFSARILGFALVLLAIATMMVGTSRMIQNVADSIHDQVQNVFNNQSP